MFDAVDVLQADAAVGEAGVDAEGVFSELVGVRALAADRGDLDETLADRA